MTAAVMTRDGRGGAGIGGRPVRRHLELYRPGPPPRPATRSRRLAPAVYRRRRLLAAGLSLLAIAAVLILVQLIQAGIGGGPLTTTGAAAGPGMIPAGTTEYVVRPGDTLWSIAARLAPGRDERPLVDRLVAETHGASIYPGQVITLPGR